MASASAAIRLSWHSFFCSAVNRLVRATSCLLTSINSTGSYLALSAAILILPTSPAARSSSRHGIGPARACPELFQCEARGTLRGITLFQRFTVAFSPGAGQVEEPFAFEAEKRLQAL